MSKYFAGDCQELKLLSNSMSCCLFLLNTSWWPSEKTWTKIQPQQHCLVCCFFTSLTSWAVTSCLFFVCLEHVGHKNDVLICFCVIIIGFHRWLSGKEPSCQFRGLGFDPSARKIPLENGMETHSSIFAWRIPWTEGLQSTGSQRARYDLVTKQQHLTLLFLCFVIFGIFLFIN